MVCVDNLVCLLLVSCDMKNRKNLCPVFAARLRAVLGLRKVSRSSLAKLCGVSTSAVTNWVNGQIPRPTVFKILTAEWGSPTIDYLLGERTTIPEPEPVSAVEV